jgi:hypothetical protein
MRMVVMEETVAQAKAYMFLGGFSLVDATSGAAVLASSADIYNTYRSRIH